MIFDNLENIRTYTIRNKVINIYSEMDYCNYYIYSNGFCLKFSNKPDINAFVSFKNLKHEGARFPNLLSSKFDMDRTKHIELLKKNNDTYEFKCASKINHIGYNQIILPEEKHLDRDNIKPIDTTEMPIKPTINTNSLALNFNDAVPNIHGKQIVKFYNEKHAYFTVEKTDCENLLTIGAVKELYGRRLQYYPFSSIQFIYSNIKDVKIPLSYLRPLDIYEDTALSVYLDSNQVFYFAHAPYTDAITGNLINPLFDEIKRLYVSNPAHIDIYNMAKESYLTLKEQKG